MRSTYCYYIICFLLAYCLSNTYAQKNEIDSLLILLKENPHDTNKITYLNELSWKYLYISEYDKGLKYANEALKLGKKINSKTGIADSYRAIGGIYLLQDDYPYALENYLSALRIYEATGNKKGSTSCFYNIGVIYESQENYKDALKNYTSSLQLYKEIDYKPGISACYNGIGNICTNTHNYPEALKNYFSFLELNQSLGNKSRIAIAYNNIATVYHNQNNYDEALKNHLIALKIRTEIEDRKGMASSYMNIGSCELKLGNVKKAKIYLEKSLTLLTEIGSIEYFREYYKHLSEVEYELGNYKNAYLFHKKYVTYRDSINNEEIQKKTIRQSMTYDFEKKQLKTAAEQEKKNLIIKEESKKQRMVIWMISFGLFLVAIFSVFVFLSLKTTRKQKQIIEVKSIETEKQKFIIEEKQKEIVDSINYAKRIQYALLAHDDILKRNLHEHFVLFKPKDIVSGDFYWATEHDEKFYIATCDSTGHGVPGAFMSLLNIGFLSEAIKEKSIVNPHEVLNYVRKRLIENIGEGDQKDGMDAVLLCVDKKSNSISYAAANNAPIIIRGTELIELPKDKMPVGKGEKTQSFTLQFMDLKKGDVIYIYTDGFADQFGGPKGKKFMYKKLNHLLTEISTLALNEQSAILEKHFDDWKGNLDQVDDVLIVGIKI